MKPIERAWEIFISNPEYVGMSKRAFGDAIMSYKAACEPEPATTEQIHDSREAFEKWHLENYGFTPSSQNQVNDSIPADRWRVWQACEAQHQHLRERVKRLEEALRFYADGNNYEERVVGEVAPNVFYDKGKTANEALEKLL